MERIAVQGNRKEHPLSAVTASTKSVTAQTQKLDTRQPGAAIIPPARRVTPLCLRQLVAQSKGLRDLAPAPGLRHQP